MTSTATPDDTLTAIRKALAELRPPRVRFNVYIPADIIIVIPDAEDVGAYPGRVIIVNPKWRTEVEMLGIRIDPIEVKHSWVRAHVLPDDHLRLPRRHNTGRAVRSGDHLLGADPLVEPVGKAAKTVDGALDHISGMRGELAAAQIALQEVRATAVPYSHSDTSAGHLARTIMMIVDANIDQAPHEPADVDR